MQICPRYALIASCGPQTRKLRCFRNSVVAHTVGPGLWTGLPEFKKRALIFLQPNSEAVRHIQQKYSKQLWGISSFVYAATVKVALRQIQHSLCGHIQGRSEACIAFILRPNSEAAQRHSVILYTAIFKADNIPLLQPFRGLKRPLGEADRWRHEMYITVFTPLLRLHDVSIHKGFITYLLILRTAGTVSLT